jgi:hypothetical protein
VLVWAFAAWTVFVWGTRISNILSQGGGTLALLVAVVLTVLGVLSAIDAATKRLPWAVPWAVVATIAVWAVRAPQVLLHDHPAGFKVVHLVLAIVSIALAIGAWRSRVRRPAPVSA